MPKDTAKPVTAPKLWTVLSRAHRQLVWLTEQSVEAAGLCLSDFMILEALLHKGPLTIEEIRSKVLLASGSMTAAADRLEHRGLLARRYSETDRRSRILELTKLGEVHHSGVALTRLPRRETHHDRIGDHVVASGQLRVEPDT